jgi:hypothetical protein
VLRGFTFSCEEMSMVGWTGNITVKMDDSENTFGPGSIEVERYSTEGIALRISSIDDRGSVVIRFSPRDCKELIVKLTQSL